MKVTLVATVLNEQESIIGFLQSIYSQTKKPDEVIIVDGGSTDATASVISNFKSLPRRQAGLKFLMKPGNRAVGRNEAIHNATGDIILSTDAGCILDKNWVANIVKPFSKKSVDVVAGYYKGKEMNVFEKCLVPYVLVMPDRVDPKNFLPASRSMAFRKNIWNRVGGFPEKYSYNEDYVFAGRLKEIGANIVFAKNAVVYWLPRKNLAEAFAMFYRFAYGDAQAGIFRPKVVILFLRFVVGMVLLATAPTALSMLFVAYILWSILKNFRYIKHWKAIFYLPLLQFTSDVSVLVGSLRGLFIR